jgi:hypothetical protein
MKSTAFRMAKVLNPLMVLAIALLWVASWSNVMNHLCSITSLYFWSDLTRSTNEVHYAVGEGRNSRHITSFPWTIGEITAPTSYEASRSISTTDRTHDSAINECEYDVGFG